VDVLTNEMVIEVKHSSRYLHALGQVLGYDSTDAIKQFRHRKEEDEVLTLSSLTI
jgi:hypothetical protein